MFLFLMLSVNCALAQQDTEDQKKSKISKATFEVKGVCGMCQKRIEKAALIKGVRMAEWDKFSQTITVMFNNKKTSVESISQAIADIGHDTELVKATDKSYRDLTGCCAYRDGIEVH